MVHQVGDIIIRLIKSSRLKKNESEIIFSKCMTRPLSMTKLELPIPGADRVPGVGGGGGGGEGVEGQDPSPLPFGELAQFVYPCRIVSTMDYRNFTELITFLLA